VDRGNYKAKNVTKEPRFLYEQYCFPVSPKAYGSAYRNILISSQPYGNHGSKIVDLRRLFRTAGRFSLLTREEEKD